MKKGVLVYPAIVILFLAGFFVLPKEEFSENENRYLQGLPEFGLERIIDGGFMKEAGAYAADRIPFRTELVGFKNCFEKYALGKSEVNGVYFCSDGYYIEKYEEPENTEEIIERINGFCTRVTGCDVYAAMAPTAVTIYEDKLPFAYERNYQKDTIKEIYGGINCKTVDVTGVLEQAGEKELYYRLDHHWTTEGAYLAYTKIAAEMGFEPLSEDFFDKETVTGEFKGTIYSKVLMPWVKGDSIDIYKSETDLTAEYKDSGEIGDSLYNFEYLNKKDKYSLFLNNIHTLVEITNNDTQTDRELVLVKDSYANCMVPFLAEHFKKIYVFDTRYYRGSISDFVNENGISDVLFLYNMNTIDTDLGIKGIY